MSLDEATIRDLIGLEDEHGVLSFYVGHTPEQAADPQPTTPIEIRNQIKALRSRIADRDASLARQVDRRLDQLGTDLDALMDPKAHGRGRALFVAVASGESRKVSVQIPFRDRVIHHDHAYIRPLVAAADEGRSAGVFVVSRESARLLRWAVGEVEELETFDFELTDAQMADMKSGPSVGNPQHPWQGNIARQRFEDRIDENRNRFLREVGDTVVMRAKSEGWDRLVISGPPKLREAIGDLLPNDDGLRLIVADQAWERDTPARIAEHAWPLLRSVHRDREVELADAAVERAMAGGAGAVGLRRVCEALNEGRVAHLLFETDRQIEGYRSDEGTLHPRVEGVVAQSDVPIRRAPLFIELMIEKAIATGALVTPIDQDISAALSDYDGVGALLRW
jgi:peptide subunit release factor 1 (eRF1)